MDLQQSLKQLQSWESKLLVLSAPQGLHSIVMCQLPGDCACGGTRLQY
jgi:hypothetical protein